jgi:glutaredoxin 3
MMPKIEIYTKSYCPYCTRAKGLLDMKNVTYTEYDVTNDTPKFEEMLKRSERRTVPQIFIDDHHIGGCDDLFALNDQKKLDPLLNA